MSDTAITCEKILAAGMAFLLCLCFSGAARASMSSGGDMEILGSVIDGGGVSMEGGVYSLKASLAQITMPNNIGLTMGGDYANRLGFYNPPHFTYQNALPTVLTMASQDAMLSFPPESTDKEVFDITVNKDPIGQPLVADPGRINEAIRKIVHNEGGWAQPAANNLAEIAVFDEQDYYTRNLANRGTLAMRYSDADNDGLVDGSNPPVRINTLSAWGLDETRNSWVELPERGSDPASHTLTVYFDRPGVFAMLGSQDLSISRNFKAYPVPFRPNGPNAGNGAGQTGTEAVGITFENAPQAGDIEIYTLDGRLVDTLDLSGNTAMPFAVTWHATTKSGGKVASGVYIWRVKTDTSVKTGKLMVIW
jgi:hypothetical protein